MTGFAKLSGSSPEGSGNKLDLSAFSGSRPVPREVSVEDERVADRVAQRQGIPGEPAGRVQLNRGKTVQDRMFVQGPLETLNRFRSFCNDKGVPLHRGLEMLLDGAER